MNTYTQHKISKIKAFDHDCNWYDHEKNFNWILSLNQICFLENPLERQFIFEISFCTRNEINVLIIIEMKHELLLDCDPENIGMKLEASKIFIL